MRLRGKAFATSVVETMAVILIAIFFALLMFRPRLAFVALMAAIVMLYRDRASNASRPVGRHVSDDSSI